MVGGFPLKAATVLRDTVECNPTVSRWLLAGPGALTAAVTIIAAMPLWWPPGTAGVDNIVYPLLLTPLIWSVVFIYTCLEENLTRGVLVIGSATIVQGFAAGLALLGVIGGHAP